MTNSSSKVSQADILHKITVFFGSFLMLFELDRSGRKYITEARRLRKKAQQIVAQLPENSSLDEILEVKYIVLEIFDKMKKNEREGKRYLEQHHHSLFKNMEQRFSQGWVVKKLLLAEWLKELTAAYLKAVLRDYGKKAVVIIKGNSYDAKRCLKIIQKTHEAPSWNMFENALIKQACTGSPLPEFPEENQVTPYLPNGDKLQLSSKWKVCLSGGEVAERTAFSRSMRP